MRPIPTRVALFVLSFVVLISQCGVAYTAVLLEDDFNDGVVDATKWNVVTAGIPWSGAEIREIGGHLETINGAFLNTIKEFKPADYGGIEITGTYSASTYNYFRVSTRSDGTPGGDWGNLRTGIDFHINEYGSVRILERQNYEWGESLAFAKEALDNITMGNFFFRIRDDGTDVSFDVYEIGNPANSVSLTGTLDKVFNTNLISIYSRHRIGSLIQVGTYDDIRVTAVPEPSSLVLWLGVGAIGLLAYVSKNRGRRAGSPSLVARQGLQRSANNA